MDLFGRLLWTHSDCFACGCSFSPLCIGGELLECETRSNLFVPSRGALTIRTNLSQINWHQRQKPHCSKIVCHMFARCGATQALSGRQTDRYSLLFGGGEEAQRRDVFDVNRGVTCAARYDLRRAPVSLCLCIDDWPLVRTGVGVGSLSRESLQ